MSHRQHLDKRGDGAEGSSPSPSPSAKARRRTGRDAAAWEDPELFGGEEEEPYAEERRPSGAQGPRRSGKADKMYETSDKWRGAGTLSGSEASDQEDKENGAEEAPTAAGGAAAAAGAAADGRRGQRRARRQPPLTAASFLQTPEGAPADGLLSLYCSLNYAREKLHKFKFFSRNAAREARMQEYKKELKAAQALLAMHARQQQQQQQQQRQQHKSQELLQAEITVRSRRRQLARLAGEERLELREDLNTLLREVREGIVAFYPYNEHASRLARRLDKLSTQPQFWAQHRPRLVQQHLAGFLKKWMASGCPSDPYALLQKQMHSSSTAAAAADEEEEEGGGREGAGGPSHMEEDLGGGAPDAHLQEEFPFPDEPWAQYEPETKPATAKKAADTAQTDMQTDAPGPSEEELRELRQKQMEAKARREKLRAAKLQQQAV
ncbi:hypothetical protein, conserved [Eimeria brunetti]|uniref:Uncharacterized protein n=1 Tax=Eimeria brunetti TaxID=51314 RepID=U6LB56_9EIME|nr:hypothetical protein, conserved [Eimeria brunetti]